MGVVETPGILAVRWTSRTLLSCVCDKNAPVILCVDPDKVAPKVCPEIAEEQPFEYGTIFATLRSYCKNNDAWIYYFHYDSDQLQEGETLLSADIFGALCQGCLTEWVEDRAGNEMYLEETEQGFSLFSPHGCEYPISSGGDISSFDFLFGDGPDGDFTVFLDEFKILPGLLYGGYGRNFYFENLTIEERGTLLPIGTSDPIAWGPGSEQFFQIFVSGTLTIDGTIQANGFDGANVSSFIPQFGEFGASAIADTGPGGWAIGGTDGGNGEGAGGSQDGGGLSYPATLPGYMGGGVGGVGGDGGGVGGAGGTIEDYQFLKLARLIFNFVNLSDHANGIGSPIYGGTGGTGGGGGARTGSALGGGGGSGAGGGGTIYIAARNIVIGATGVISANGGNGGDGGEGTLGGGGDVGNGGGGGGAGGGGVVYLIYETLTNNGAIEVNGGVGGSGGSGVGGGANGEDGNDGANGRIYLLNVTTGMFE